MTSKFLARQAWMSILTSRPSLFSKASLKTRGPRWALCESRAAVRAVVAVTTNLHRSQGTPSGHASSTESFEDLIEICKRITSGWIIMVSRKG
jgi:hypothetical protein